MPKRNIVVEALKQTPVEEQYVEFVERKGLGHPDYIADSIAERYSVALCQEYMNSFGRVLHHNVDKVLVVGGQANPRYGGGEVITPIYVLISGRVTSEVRVDGETRIIPVGRIAVESAKRWFRENFRFLDPEQHVIIDFRIGRGSVDLVGVFDKSVREVPRANDTSFGVSFAPLDTLEKLVYETERMLNSKDFKERYPEVGEDVKVMGVRVGRKISLTIAAAMVSHLVPDKDHYLSVKEEVANRVADMAVKMTDMPVEVFINTADDVDQGIAYLTVTGTSAEQGDDGETGRGNRVNGLITPSRPMSLEATAGKNPVSHVGKLYNVIARRIANRISAEVHGVREVYVKLLSQIGKPIDNPYVSNIQLVLEKGTRLTSGLKSEVKQIANEELDKILDLLDECMKCKVELF